MRIAFFTDTYLPEPNGVAENVALSAKSLEERGHTVYVAAPKNPHFKEKDPNVLRLSSVRVYKNPEFRLFVPLPQSELHRLTRLKADIFHGHAGGTLTVFGWELAKVKDVPYVFTYHTLLNRYTHYLPGNLVRPKVAEVATKVYCNLTDHVIAPTARVKKELLSYGVTKPISVVPGGVDLSRFRVEDKDYLRKRYNLPKETKILLYVGRLGKEKRVDFLLRAFKIINSQQKETRLVLVGDGPDREKLKELARNLKINPRVIFTGFIGREQMPQVYADADIFVFASKTETQGLVITEAMTSGLPVVAVADEAFDGVVLDGKTGFLVEGDRREFAKKVLRLLENQLLRKQFAQAARSHIEEHFSAEAQAKSLEKIYRAVIAEHQAKHRRIAAIKQRILEAKNYLNLYERFAKFKGF